jgi:hypothetical protein
LRKAIVGGELGGGPRKAIWSWTIVGVLERSGSCRIRSRIRSGNRCWSWSVGVGLGVEDDVSNLVASVTAEEILDTTGTTAGTGGAIG